MTARFPVANYRQLAKVAKTLGFYLYRQAKGSHEIWKREGDGRLLVLVNHGSKDFKRKTLKSALVGLGISPEEFLKLK